MADDDETQPPAPVARSGAREWTACRYADVLAILADSRFEVAGAGPAGSAGPVSTPSWLRASVSRFANGAQHRQRRARAVAELHLLDPGRLRRAAYRRSVAVMTAATGPGQRFDEIGRASCRERV